MLSGRLRVHDMTRINPGPSGPGDSAYKEILSVMKTAIGSDRSWTMRVCAVEVLNNFGSHAKEVIPHLIESMRFSSIISLVGVLPKEFGMIVEEDVYYPILGYFVSYKRDEEDLEGQNQPPPATAVLAAMREPAVPYLVAALQNSNLRIRRWAAYSLGEMGSTAQPALEELTILSTQEPITIVKEAIEAALAKIQGKSLPQ